MCGEAKLNVKNMKYLTDFNHKPLQWGLINKDRASGRSKQQGKAFAATPKIFSQELETPESCSLATYS